MSNRVYLDYNATAPIRPEARDAAVCALEIGGNPSSVHALGRLARAAVERARTQVAALVAAPSDAVTFTSGGTEANAIAVASAIAAGARRPLVLMSEHDSVLAPVSQSGLWVEAWPVLHDGLADLDWLEHRLCAWKKEDGAPFAAMALANNETGVIQPVAEAAALMRRWGGFLHVDAVQAAGKLAIDIQALGADTLSLSAHKIGGPHGAGALIAAPRAQLRRRQSNVGQERGVRPGTENVSGIAGFGAACASAARDLPLVGAQGAWRDQAAERLKGQGCLVAGESAPRLSATLCVICEGWESQLQVMALDLAGVMVSAGAACSSGKVTPSHVLAAMQMGDLAGYGVRASGGWASVAADWTSFADAWLNAFERRSLRKRVA